MVNIIDHQKSHIAVYIKANFRILEALNPFPMGLFSSVIHVYKKSQAEIIKEFSAELQQNYGISKISRLQFDSSNYKNVISNDVEGTDGVFYLITPSHGNWATIVELNVNIEEPFYFNEMLNSLSQRLDTYCLSFHLHDGDVLYYNLDKSGESLDGYNSDYQYFLDSPAPKEEILSQRHDPHGFSPLIPAGKTTEGLNKILNEGYWSAFDKNELNENGNPADFDKYYVEEEERLERTGKYLEIFSESEYPFANWYSNMERLNLSECYLLKANK